MKAAPVIDRQSETEFIIDYAVRTSWEMKNYHFHEEFEVFFSLSDGVKCFVEDKVYDVKRGDLFVFNPLVLHRTVVPEGVTYERYVLCFKGEYLREFVPSSWQLLEQFFESDSEFNLLVHLKEKQFSDFLELLRKAQHYIETPVYRQEMYKKLVLMEILLYINSVFVCSNTLREVSSDSSYLKIKPVIEYIRTNLNEALSLNALSSKFYMSKSYLGALFKKYTGFTVNEYIISRRISKACDLLKRNYTVYQVCDMTGFNNYSHFIRTFTNLVGISPKQYSKL